MEFMPIRRTGERNSLMFYNGVCADKEKGQKKQPYFL
jgi:hypothetical protein